ncbi:hypothetical protein [Streptomyces sp. NPDC002588]|uniref:hypothetical protein n=1 Tax=Streptomyces sp. NPDC002588 TaxID=3154419 RepID=UPI003329275D
MDLVAIVAAAVIAGVAAGMQTGVSGVVAGWFRRDQRNADEQQGPEAGGPADGEPAQGTGPVLQVDGSVHAVGGTDPLASSGGKYAVTVDNSIILGIGDHTSGTINAAPVQSTAQS